MSANQIDAEREALTSLMQLLEYATKTQRLYERAHMSLPEPLKRMLGMNGNGNHPAASRFIASPDYPSRPAEATGEWIPIQIKHATPTSVVLALLRKADSSIRARDLVAAVQEILPDVSSGTIANIGSRLQGARIRRTDNGWKIDKQESAGIISGDFLWGPHTIFGVHELASHRRDAIRHLLTLFTAGLQTSQIIEELRKCGSWMRAPVNKELVQDDIEILAEGQEIRRRGNSRKWELAPKDDMKLKT